MSLLDELVDSDFVKISRSPDFDHFRSIEGLGEASSIPLDCRDFAASFASLRLKACTIYLQRTFPRILQVQYSTTGAIVGLLMDDAASLILNGVAARAPAFLLVRGSAKCEIVEQHSNLVAFVNFDSIDDRGWPSRQCPQRFAVAHLYRLRTVDAVTGEVRHQAEKERQIGLGDTLFIQREKERSCRRSIWRWLPHRRRPKPSA